MKIDLEIVEKVISGNGTSEEKAMVEEWLSSDSKHAEFCERIKDYHDDDFENEDVSQHEVEQRWSDFQFENRTKFGKKRRKIALTLRAVSVAAALVVLTFLLLPLMNGDHSELSVAALEEKKPIIIRVEPIASDVVTITTASGEEYKVNQTDTVSQTPLKDIAVLNNSAISYDHAKAKAEVELHTLTTPIGKDYKVVLSDGTTVHLNANSRLIYPSSFSTDKERRVQLTGEAFFDVAHDKNRQFVVETSEIDVRVYGTKFNVNTNKRNVVETVLVEGAVTVMGDTFAERLIKPEEMAQYNSETGKLEVREVEVMNYVSWRTGTYSFFEETLENIMLSLSSWYDEEIEFTDEKSAQMKFVCNLPRYSTIEEVMDVLVMSGNIQYNVVDGRVIISKK